MLGDGSFATAMKEFEKKFKDKSGLRWADRGEEPKAGKYAYVERSYNPESDDDVDDDDAGTGADVEDTKDSVTPADSTLSPPVQDLMKLIFNQVRLQHSSDSWYQGVGEDVKLTVDRTTLTQPCLRSTTMPTSFHWAS
jgi:hypothetical protein